MGTAAHIDWRSLKVPPIRWEEFSEAAIQRIIIYFLSSAGWDVYPVHFADPAHEDGADIVAERDGKRLLIAVKIKPKKPDFGQFAQLAHNDSDQKIYIHIAPPAKSFQDLVEKGNYDVMFLSPPLLDSWLYWLSPPLYIVLLTDFSSFGAAVRDLQLLVYKKILSAVRDSKGAIIQRREPVRMRGEAETKTLLKVLWRLKDDSAALHKLFSHLILVFEHANLSEPYSIEALSVLWAWEYVLDSAQTYLRSAIGMLNILLNKYPEFLFHVATKTLDSSHWIYFGAWRPETSHSIEREDLDLSSLRSADENVAKAFADMARCASIVMNALEDLVDDLFSELLGVTHLELYHIHDNVALWFSGAPYDPY